MSDESPLDGLADILWPIDKVADFWGVSTSRARALLASRGIKRISAYPADQVRRVVRRQGARTDRLPASPPPAAEPDTSTSLGPIQRAVLECLADGELWTPTRIAVTMDPSKDSESATVATRTLVIAGLGHLERRGYAGNTSRDGWHITSAGLDIVSRNAD